jgi:3-methyladenine DNA glycosylase AlkD
VGIDAGSTAAGIEERLRSVGTPDRAESERRYLKSDLEFLGATVWEVRREVKAFVKDRGDFSHAEVVALVEALWSKPVHERRAAAAMLLGEYPELVGPADLPLLERLVRESKTWAYVDVLAADVLGELLVRHPRTASKLDRWARDRDFWVRRAALLAQLKPLASGASFARFGRYAEAMLDEKEFFIRKAIGWVLRETGKRRPDDVFEWLAPRTHRASGVTLREAVKYLEPEQRETLMEASRGRRPVVLPQR